MAFFLCTVCGCFLNFAWLPAGFLCSCPTSPCSNCAVSKTNNQRKLSIPAALPQQFGDCRATIELSHIKFNINSVEIRVASMKAALFHAKNLKRVVFQRSWDSMQQRHTHTHTHTHLQWPRKTEADLKRTWQPQVGGSASLLRTPRQALHQLASPACQQSRSAPTHRCACARTWFQHFHVQATCAGRVQLD